MVTSSARGNVLETEVGIMKIVVSKLDISIDKITQVSNDIGRLLAVHDERISNLEKSHNRRISDITDIHEKLNIQTKEILAELVKVEEILEKKLADTSLEYKTHSNAIEKKLDEDISKIDVRVSTLERLKYYIIGGAVVIGYLVNKALELFKT